MKVIVVGCGRMGSGLTSKLLHEGHEVTLIDLNREAYKSLPKHENLKVVIGVGFDKEVLEKADITRSDALVACTNSDESNALIARISKNIYKVPRVIARLFDPNKARIYKALGIQTISTTEWGIHRASEIISYNQLDSILTIGNSEVEIVKVEVPVLLAGRSVDELTILGEIRLIAVSRDNQTLIPTRGMLLQQNDVIYISVLSKSLGRLKTLLGLD